MRQGPSPVTRSEPTADRSGFRSIQNGKASSPLSDSKRIPVAGPWITDREIAYVSEAVRDAWYDNANVFHERFETAFADYVGRRYAISLPSCTSGLHLALAALGIGPGDEVIVPDLTWIASCAPVSYVGATPVFVDIEPDTWCLSAEAFAAAITERTKAVIVVDLYGNMPEMRRILDIASERGVSVIEDAAEAIGSLYDGRPAGSFGLASAFSFHGSKTLTTGEGGMLVTDDKSLYDRCMSLRDHGRTPGDVMFFNQEVGFKYKMSSLQAALGLGQIERIDELVERKRQIFSWYQSALQDMNGFRLNSEAGNVRNTYWMVSAVFDEKLGITKEQLVPAMKELGIDTRPIFYPLSMIPAYNKSAGAELARSRNKVAYSIGPHGINLPSGFNMNLAFVERVAQGLRQVLAEFLAL